MRRGEGITGAAAADRAPVMIAADAHLDPRFKAFPNLPEDDYASILAVPILGAREARGRAQRPHPRAAGVHAGGGRPADDDRRRRSRSRSSTRSSTRRRSGASTSSRRSPGSRRRSPSRSTSRSRSRRSCKTTVESTHATGAAIVLEDGRIAWPEGRAGRPCRAAAAALARQDDRRARRRPGHAVHATTTASCSRRSRARPRSRSSTAGWRCAACSPRRSTTASRTTSRPSRRSCASRRAPANVDPHKALGDSVNRILAIAAVHEVLTEHREDDVELDELIDRLRAMLVQGLAVGKEVSADARARLARGPAGDVARARLHRAVRERARARRRP